MIIATERIIPGVLPPKEPTPDVDFLSILHSFDPSTCTDEALEVFAERYSGARQCVRVGRFR